MKNIPLAVFVSVLFSGLACLDRGGQNGPQGAASASLCEQGRARFDATRNECLCAPGQTWNGEQCEDQQHAAPNAGQSPSPLTLQDTPSPVPDTASHIPPAVNRAPQQPLMEHDASDAPAETETPQQGAASVQTSTRQNQRSSLVQQLKAACGQAGGSWVAADAYCYCPKAKILAGNKCVKAPGYVTKSLCTSALSPGRWSKGQCSCDGTGKIFSPARGGCVSMRIVSETTLRRLCESSLEGGRWNAWEHRCDCPSRKIFAHERCYAQAELSSEKVCESEFNRGRWDHHQKLCLCPRGRVWLNQTCTLAGSVEASLACRSEANGGSWDDKLGTCVCPQGGQWKPAEKRCWP